MQNNAAQTEHCYSCKKLWMTAKIFNQPLIVIVVFVELFLMQLQFENGFSLLAKHELLLCRVMVCQMV